MARVEIQPSVQGVAEVAAGLIADNLTTAIAQHGNATWVLTGGTMPAQVYPILLQKYGDKLDWEHLYIVMGDERCVPAGHADSNWRLKPKRAYSNTLLCLRPTSYVPKVNCQLKPPLRSTSRRC